MNHDFKVGDLIEPRSNDSYGVEFLCGRSKTGKYEVTSITSSTVYVRPEGTHSIATSINASKFLPKVRRVEGEEIKPENIKVGDTIRVSKVSGKMTMIHEAVVGDIKRKTDTKHYGTLLFYTEQFTHTAQRINWGKDADETFTLIKAVPERDKLADRLVGALGGQTITFRESLARKQNDEKWTMLTGAVVNIMTTEGLRTYIKNSEVVWLKEES